MIRCILLVAALALLSACTEQSDSAASTAPSVAAPPAPASTTAALTSPEPYWVEGKLCGEDDCDNIPGRWRAFGAADLYAQADGATIAGRVAKDEWVKAVEKRTRYTPQRGVVSAAGGGLSVGDVVFGPYSGADDTQQVLHDGAKITIEADAETPRIDWDPLAPNTPQRVTWVRIERESGPGGWLRDPDFACMGEHPPSEDGCE